MREHIYIAVTVVPPLSLIRKITILNDYLLVNDELNLNNNKLKINRKYLAKWPHKHFDKCMKLVRNKRIMITGIKMKMIEIIFYF